MDESKTETAWDSKYEQVRDETKSLGEYSNETKTEPRVSSFTAPN